MTQRFVWFLALLGVLTSVACSTITGGGGDSSSPVTVPPEGLIAFVVDYTGADADNDIYIVAPDGTSLRRLTEDSYLNTSPVWSPDGSQIAFRSNRTGYFSNLFVMKTNGSDERNLTKNDRDHHISGWTADGKQIVMEEGAGNTYTPKVIDVADPNRARDLVEPEPRQRLSRPSLSPDGKRLLYDDVQNVYVINLDGRQTTRLTNGAPRETNNSATWSGDGSEILFISRREGVDELYLMKGDGSAQTRLTNGTHAVAEMRRSPDGRQIVFRRERRPDVITTTGELWMVNADGSNERRLTMQDCDGQYGFDWSPDSSRVVFTRGCARASRSEPSELHVINVDGTGERRVASEIKRAISDPAWSPAGKR